LWSGCINWTSTTDWVIEVHFISGLSIRFLIRLFIYFLSLQLILFQSLLEFRKCSWHLGIILSSSQTHHPLPPIPLQFLAHISLMNFTWLVRLNDSFTRLLLKFIWLDTYYIPAIRIAICTNTAFRYQNLLALLWFCGCWAASTVWIRPIILPVRVSILVYFHKLFVVFLGFCSKF
jgi:hypothetical protein